MSVRDMARQILLFYKMVRVGSSSTLNKMTFAQARTNHFTRLFGKSFGYRRYHWDQRIRIYYQDRRDFRARAGVFTTL